MRQSRTLRARDTRRTVISCMRQMLLQIHFFLTRPGRRLEYRENRSFSDAFFETFLARRL